MYQPLIKFHPHPAIITQVLRIFAALIAGEILANINCDHRHPFKGAYVILDFFAI